MSDEFQRHRNAKNVRALWQFPFLVNIPPSPRDASLISNEIVSMVKQQLLDSAPCLTSGYVNLKNKILSDEGVTRILSGYLQHLWGWGYERATVSILQIPGDESAGGVTYCRIRIEGKFGVTQILSTWDRMGLGKVRNHQ